MTDSLKVPHFITVAPDQAGQRIDNFLRTRYKNLPKSRLYRIIRKGEVRVNKKRIDPDYRLKSTDCIRMPPLKDESDKTTRLKIKPDHIHVALAKKIAMSVLYENKHLLIMNKPSGLAVHAGSGVRLGIIELLRILYPKEKYLELAHRLDRETSGCLLIAKKPSILKECHALLREHKINKYYLCLVKGKWPDDLTCLDQAIEGKPSVTHIKILRYYQETTLLEAKLDTGRHHQIRLHVSQAGHPVVADDKYGDWVFNKRMRAYQFDRLFLHAHRLSFDLPSTQQHINVIAPIDLPLQNGLNRLNPLERVKNDLQY